MVDSNIHTVEELTMFSRKIGVVMTTNNYVYFFYSLCGGNINSLTNYVYKQSKIDNVTNKLMRAELHKIMRNIDDI